MAYFLRFLLVIMTLGLLLTLLSAFHIQLTPYGHIQLAIPSFILTIFIQAFIMFYFIGVSRFTENIAHMLSQKKDLNQLFDEIPQDLSPYSKKLERYLYSTSLAKRKTIPWTMLILVLGSIGFLLGGAHDTGLVQKTTHSGVIFGFFAAVAIGFYHQWLYLGKTHLQLREIKYLFSIPHHQM